MAFYKLNREFFCAEKSRRGRQKIVQENFPFMKIVSSIRNGPHDEPIIGAYFESEAIASLLWNRNWCWTHENNVGRRWEEKIADGDDATEKWVKCVPHDGFVVYYCFALFGLVEETAMHNNSLMV